MNDVYSVACRLEGGCGNERVIFFHWYFTRVPSYIGLLKCSPYLLTVVSEK